MKHSLIFSLAAGLFVFSGLVGCQPAKEDVKPAGDVKVAADDMKTLEGTWTLVSGEKDGAPLPDADIKNSKLTIAGDVHTVQVGDMHLKGTHKLDQKKSPKQIDAHDTEGPTVGENHGIYELTAAGEFRVSFAPTGKDRPTEFASKPGSGNFTHVWKRAKAE